MSSYIDFCNSFSSIIPQKNNSINNIEKNLLLEQAGIKLEYQEYKNVMITTTILATIFAFAILIPLYLLFPSIIPLYIPIIIPIIIPSILGILFQILPQTKLNGKAKNIDRYLPFAINYINTMAKANIAPVDIFRSLSDSTSYGILKDESLKIVKELELMGVDNITALKHAIDRSPSKKFKGFLQGLIGTIQAGSNLTTYLSNMADYYMEEDLRTREKDLESLGLVAELFVTTVIAFPIFLVIIVIVFGFIGESSVAPFDVIYLVTFLILPVCYLTFYYLVKTTLNEEYKVEEKQTKKLTLSQYYVKNKQIIHIFSLSIALLAAFILIMIFVFQNNIITYSHFYLYDIAFISLLIMIEPYGLYCYFKLVRGNEVQNRFPDLLVDLGNSLSSGMSVFDSIEVASKGYYGKLTPEIQKMKIDLSWHMSIGEIFTNLAHRLKNNIIDRTVLTINKALYMGGGNETIFKSLSKEIKQINQIGEQRNVHMSMYLMIIVISFMVFLFIMIILNTTLFSYFFEYQGTAASASGGFITSLDPTQLHYALFSFSFVQSIGSGLLGGYMKDGAIAPGLRYSLALGLITIILFKVVL